mgnify:CR=1 FL=1
MTAAVYEVRSFILDFMEDMIASIAETTVWIYRAGGGWDERWRMEGTEKATNGVHFDSEMTRAMAFGKIRNIAGPTTCPSTRPLLGAPDSYLLNIYTPLVIRLSSHSQESTLYSWFVRKTEPFK